MTLPLSLQQLLDSSRGCGVTLTVDLPIAGLSTEQKIARILEEARFRVPDLPLLRVTIDQAAALITHLIAYDQAYGRPTDAFSIAESCSAEFVGLFPQGSTFFSNSEALPGSEGRKWIPVTDSTFDSGVIVVSADRGGLLWFEEED